MSTFNISQKIGTGGSFRNTTGAGTLITTTAGQYAKVRIAGYVEQTGLSARSLTLSVGGNALRILTTANNGNIKTLSKGELNFQDPENENGFIDLIVPPSSSLVLTSSGAGGVNYLIVGTYVIIENTL